FLKEGDAVIIDLRRNGGGSPQAVQHMISHFMEAERPLVTFYMNGEPSPDRLSTLRDLPVGRFVGKPLYVLVSGSTASAAEEFAGHVAGYRLGELVGENTAGAGFRNEVLPINGGFLFSVSVGRAVLASTGKDWEAVGHAPTIAVPVGNALDAAHAHALRRIAAAAPAGDRARFEALADSLAARSERRAAALPFAAYAGAYGERTISVEGDRLFYQRATRPREPLIALGGNRFMFESDPTTVVEFMPSGTRVTAITVGTAGGPVQGRYERTQ
ncbi:MAG TPA: S41 family peptidase, partial [Allosphingosinicella sp.]